METKSHTEQTTQVKPTHKEKRQELKEISKIAKGFQNSSCEGMTINEILIDEFYTDEENQEFKTLFDWSKNGFKVLKGSKSFLIWGKPRKLKDKTEAPKPQATEGEDESEFYPLCYLFSNAQVVKKDAKE
jgi:hypothetical protein